MEEITRYSIVDKLIRGVGYEVDTLYEEHRLKVRRTVKDTRYNREYCIYLYHNEDLIVRRCISQVLYTDVQTLDDSIWTELEMIFLRDFIKYALFAEKNMISETIELKEVKRNGR